MDLKSIALLTTLLSIVIVVSSAAMLSVVDAEDSDVSSEMKFGYEENTVEYNGYVQSIENVSGEINTKDAKVEVCFDIRSSENSYEFPVTFTVYDVEKAQLSLNDIKNNTGSRIQLIIPPSIKINDVVYSIVLTGGLRTVINGIDTLVILGNHEATRNPVVPNADILKTVIIDGNIKNTNGTEVAILRSAVKTVKTIYYGPDCSEVYRVSNSTIGNNMNIYLTSTSETEIKSYLVKNTNPCLNLYFSEESVMPKEYGTGFTDEVNTPTSNVTFHIHTESEYWESYSTTGHVASNVVKGATIPSVEGYPTYSISVSESEWGSITVDRTSAYSGQVLTVTVLPVEGYRLKTITSLNEDVVLTKGEGRNYCFTMPSHDVTLTPVFESASPSIECKIQAKGSQVIADITLNGAVTEEDIPTTMKVYFKYKDQTGVDSFTMMKTDIKSFSSGYSITASSSMSSLTPVECLIQVFSNDLCLNEKVVTV